VGQLLGCQFRSSSKTSGNRLSVEAGSLS